MWGRAVLAVAAITTAGLLNAGAGDDQREVLHVTPKACYSKIEMGLNFECVGPDLKHLTCSGIILTSTESLEKCEYLRVAAVRPKP